MLPSTWQSSEAKIKHLARLRKIRFHLLLVLNLWQFLHHESVRFSLKWTLSTAQKRFKCIYWILQMYNAYSSPPKKHDLISFFLHGFILQTLPIKQSEAKSDGLLEPWSKNPNVCRHMSAWSIHPLHQFVQCHSSDLSNVQNNRMAGPGLWNAEQSFVGVGSIWLWCPFFVGHLRPILRIWIQKKQTEKCLKRNEWSNAKTFNHGFNWYDDNNTKNQKNEMLYKSWTSQLQFRVWRQETSILQDCDFQEICLQDLCLSRSTGRES